MTGSCLPGRCLTIAPTDRPSSQSECTQGRLSATNCPFMSMWVPVSHKNFKSDARFFAVKVGDTWFCCLCHRTQQITSDPLASHCGSRSTTQRAVRCWMRAGQQLSRNLWVAQQTLHHFYISSHLAMTHVFFFMSVQIQFFKDCGEDDVCTTDLVLQAHMDISGTRYSYEMLYLPPWLWKDQRCTHLLRVVDFSMRSLRRQKPYVIRSPRRRLAVEVQLQNRLENAYNTSLTLQYSRNLHFSSLSIRVNPTHMLPALAESCKRQRQYTP